MRTTPSRLNRCSPTPRSSFGSHAARLSGAATPRCSASRSFTRAPGGSTQTPRPCGWCSFLTASRSCTQWSNSRSARRTSHRKRDAVPVEPGARQVRGGLACDEHLSDPGATTVERSRRRESDRELVGPRAALAHSWSYQRLLVLLQRLRRTPLARYIKWVFKYSKLDITSPKIPTNS